MKDAALFRQLLDEKASADALGPLLEDLARLPVARRWPFLGALDPALAHASAAVRERAVCALAGATGITALERIVDALDDADAGVRLRAVEALRISCDADPPRFVHALFHPEAEIRAHAVAAHPPAAIDWYQLHLLADPACAPAVRARLVTIVPPAAALPTILAQVDQGLLDRVTARRFVGVIPKHELLVQVRARGGVRPRADLERIRETVAGTRTEPGTASASPEAIAAAAGPVRDIDRVFDLFFDDAAPASAPDADRAIIDRFFESLAVWLALQSKEARKEDPETGSLAAQVVAAVLAVSARRRRLPAAAVLAGAIADPASLGFKGIPVEARRAAAGALCGRPIKGLATPEVVKLLVLTDVCREADGRLDLRAVAGLLHFLEKEPYPQLFEWVKGAEIKTAFALSPIESAVFLTVADPSGHGRNATIQWALGIAGVEAPPLFATLLGLLPPGEWTFLDGAKRADAIGVALLLLAETGEARARPVSEALAKPILGDEPFTGFEMFLATWLGRAEAEKAPLGLALLARLSRDLTPARVRDLVLALDETRLERLLRALDASPGSVLPEKEAALAEALRDHRASFARAFAERRRRAPDGPTVAAGAATAAAAPAAAPPPGAGAEVAAAATPAIRVPPKPGEDPVRKLTRAEAAKIATAAELDLAEALAPCLAGPRRGVVPALERRPVPRGPSVEACLAILAAHDPPDRAAAQLARFGAVTDEGFVATLDEGLVRLFGGCPHLPLLGHAWLHRFEHHGLAFTDVAAREAGGFAHVLRQALDLAAAPAVRRIWEAASAGLATLAYRDRRRLATILDAATVATLVDGLCSPIVGELAARALALLHRLAAGTAAVEPFREAILGRLPYVEERVRAALGDVLTTAPPPVPGRAGARSASAPSALSAPSASSPRARPGTLAAIASCDDPEALTAILAGPPLDAEKIEAAAARLAALGPPGIELLVRILRLEPRALGAAVAAATVATWPEGPHLDEVESLLAEPSVPADVRFRAGAGLLAKGHVSVISSVLAAACEPSVRPVFRTDDYKRLADLGVISEVDLARALAASPHANAHRPAIERLLAEDEAAGRAPARALDPWAWTTWVDPGRRPAPAADPRTVEALVAFLDAGPERSEDLRVRVAEKLLALGDVGGLPVLLRAVVEDLKRRRGKKEKEKEAARPLRKLDVRGLPALAQAAAGALLVAGPSVVPEDVLVPLVADAIEVGEADREDVLARVSVEASLAPTRAAARKRLRPGIGRTFVLRRVAETFAWGVRVGRRLTGRLFQIKLVRGEGLGYTRLEEDRIWVNTLPMLKGEPRGRDIVQALILHEFGHHLYHRGKEAQAIWKKADQEGLGRVLNLVADEHLERNLRAISEAYGDRLKRLAAYAFQHSASEIAVPVLLEDLGARTFAVLTKTALRVARTAGCVRLRAGKVLFELEAAGFDFARFVRALRMGLGNRHDDPRVDAALRLFERGFRRSSMERLYEIAKKLREIFGHETCILNRLGQDASLRVDGEDVETFGEGIEDDEVQREVERVLDPSKRERGGAGAEGKGPPKLWINVSVEERFEPITKVEKVPFARDPHDVYARAVARQAARLRSYLIGLGLAALKVGGRVRGREVDRARLRALALRGEPRVLISREIESKTDLFIGIVIDCSGSMASGDRMERAKRFAMLIAGATRGLPGIELRAFGFTDKVIYDAGDARQCAVHGLKAQGGNNDAAALAHAAAVAARSKRRAKLLVMVSDGLPTECSVAALKGLVKRLSKRMRMCCAQVAVADLKEVCFPHYVVVNDANIDAAVRAFGRVVARLVKVALG